MQLLWWSGVGGNVNATALVLYYVAVCCCATFLAVCRSTRLCFVTLGVNRYAVLAGGCLLLTCSYCNTLEWSRLDWWQAGFRRCFNIVYWVIWPARPVFTTHSGNDALKQLRSRGHCHLWLTLCHFQISFVFFHIGLAFSISFPVSVTVVQVDHVFSFAPRHIFVMTVCLC